MALTAKQERFCAEYAVDLNATQAAIRAGYSPKTAKAQGSRLLTNADVKARVEADNAARAAKLALSADWVVEKLKQNVERAMQAEPVYDREGNKTGEYTYQGAVANGALNLLGKHIGMFVDKVEHSGKDDRPFRVRLDLGTKLRDDDSEP